MAACLSGLLGAAPVVPCPTQALEKLASKPPKKPAATADSGSEVSDVELSESDMSDLEGGQLAGGNARQQEQQPRRRLQQAGDVVMVDAWRGQGGGRGGPRGLKREARAAEEWEVYEPPGEDSGEEWGGGGRRGRGGGRGRGRRGSRKAQREAAKEAERRGAWQQQLPPRQRLALRALATAVSGVAAENTVASVLRQAQQQAAQAHAALAAVAVPDAMLVPAGSADAPQPTLPGTASAAAGGNGSKPASGISASSCSIKADISGIRVPSAVPAFQELTELPQYRRNLESHCT
jgi:hypothetical protein